MSTSSSMNVRFLLHWQREEQKLLSLEQIWAQTFGDGVQHADGLSACQSVCSQLRSRARCRLNRICVVMIPNRKSNLVIHDFPLIWTVQSNSFFFFDWHYLKDVRPTTYSSSWRWKPLTSPPAPAPCPNAYSYTANQNLRVKFIKKLTKDQPFLHVDPHMGSLRFSQSPYQQCLKWEFGNWHDYEVREEPQGEVMEKPESILWFG